MSRSKVCFYTIRFEGDTENETDKFFKKHYPEYQDDISIIYSWIKQLENRGADKRYFRFENNASAGPIESSNLRIYCIRYHNGMVILDGGGVKVSQSVQDSPSAYPYFNLMNKIDKAITQKIKDGDIKHEGDYLTGELFVDI